jgi:hypothetical protein
MERKSRTDLIEKVMTSFEHLIRERKAMYQSG